MASSIMARMQLYWSVAERCGKDSLVVVDSVNELRAWMKVGQSILFVLYLIVWSTFKVSGVASRKVIARLCIIFQSSIGCKC